MMLLIFTLGVMNVLWMAALGIVMTIEKMLKGRRFTYAIGGIMAAIGISLIVTAVAAHWPARTI
jgi:predicted metal-binding membrane protein